MANTNTTNTNSTDTDDFNFFHDLSPPDSYETKKDKLNQFANTHVLLKNRIVLVTSGGTTVPLESRTVRFIDNFSIGTRGATSAEYFLKQGYAVIFLHRQRSLLPFYQRVEKNILDILIFSDEDENDIKVSRTHAKKLAPFLKDYQTFKDTGMLCMVEFTTLSDYLYLLRAACEAISVCGNKGMIYLAAAVSDFYIPKGLMLETNHEILIEKAKKALATYNHQMVIANLLDTRKKEVYIVTKETEERVQLTEEELAAGREIEQPIIDKLVAYHTDLLLS
ncbi:phosphopantothenate--cysteine ligase-like isoform X2 [Biomphalaria glabrata]|uniref:Phosphopantothenate--cysteine ligase-like isoform X2 n=1 Tax=Biomphalaria glabrata TaxID=6526 RepID=A0A9W2YCP0_BIOGL|nr:phosphopantothenate--cysteine ligase-like isoform X2 [Biomphalaria glabrata]